MRILAVDDDPVILELLEAVISTFDSHDLQTALSGMDALEVLRQNASNPFDCLLLDIQMPEMDGIELCRRIRQLDGYRRTPIIMITAMSGRRYVDNAFHAGASDYVTKPFDILDVQSRLGLAERRLEEARDGIGKVFTAKRAQEIVPETTGKASLCSQVPIFDVDNLIEADALENYVAQLSRSKQNDTGVFAFSIRRVASLYDRCSKVEFEGLLADIAEAISDTLRPHQFLLTYAGSGTYLCVTEDGYRPDIGKVTDAVNLTINQMGLCFSDGTDLRVRVAVGDFVRLIWRDQNGRREALIQAYASAEDRARIIEKEQDDFWYLGRAIG